MLHKEAVKRIEEGVGLSGSDLLGVFRELARAAETCGSDCTECNMSYLGADDDFVPGTFVPELTLRVRKVLPDDPAPQQ